MSLGLKRASNKDEGSLSPPPTRRKLGQGEQSLPGSVPSSDNYLRIFSWNVNGIGPFLQRPISFSGTALVRSPLRTFLARHNWPQILCLQEVKINPKDTATQRALHHAANLDPSFSSKNNATAASPNPTYTVHFSLPRDRYNATGFGGKVHGVATLIRDDLPQTLAMPTLTTTTRRVAWDLEGRVLITTLSVPSTPPSTSSLASSEPPTTTFLHIIHAYFPNGTTYPYRSPTTGIPHGTRHDHKLRFHASILSEALSLQSSHEIRTLNHPSHHQKQTPTHRFLSSSHVLLIGDANIAPTPLDGHPSLRTSPVQHVSNRADFNAKFLDQGNGNGLGGVDVWRALRGGERKYTYHPRGGKWGACCDRVDLVVVGRGLLDLERGVGEGEGEGDVGKGVEVGEERGEGGDKMRKAEGGKRPEGAVVGMEIYDNQVDRGHSDHVPLSVTLDLGKLIVVP